MKFSIKNLFSKCEQICSFLQNDVKSVTLHKCYEFDFDEFIFHEKGLFKI